MNVLVRNWHTVKDTASTLRHGSTSLGQLPMLVAVLLRDEAWRQFALPSGEVIDHERFADFVVTEPPAGLGTTVALVRKLVAEDKTALDLLDQAVQNPPGRPRTPNNVQSSREGNTEDAALRRLRKDAPELHAEVLAGALSAHAAMVRAGFRPRTLSVPIGQPDRIAAALRRHLSDEDLRLVAKLLAGD